MPPALKGARIGIPRAFYYDKIAAPGDKEPRGGLDADPARVMGEAIATLRQQGAVVVDPADIPSIVSTVATSNFLLWPMCAGVDNSRGKDADCSIVFKYGMKRDFNKWLASLGSGAPVKTLTELRQWNVAHQKMGAIKYGQAQIDNADEMDVELDRSRYLADRAKDLRLSAAEGIDAVMKQHALDALMFPGATGRGHCRQAGLSHGHRAVRVRAQCSDAAVPRRVCGEAGALRCELHRAGLLRASSHRARVHIRAGHETPCATAIDALGRAIRTVPVRGRYDSVDDLLIHVRRRSNGQEAT